MHGLGNDYVFVDTFTEQVADPASLARAVSDRHAGVGSDGLILIGPSDAADVRMEMYNADGSRGLMCGNGIRCVAKYAVEQGLAAGPGLQIDTDSGVRLAECELVDGRVRSVRVDMGRPGLTAAAIPTTIGIGRTTPHRAPTDATPSGIVNYALRIGDAIYAVTCVSMGNPHAVVFVDDLETIELAVIGPKIEHAPEFPEGINAHFARVDGPTHVTVRTWERGSGATQACGTGACAVCVAGVLTGRTERNITVTLPGGDLVVEWAGDDHLYMTGPAVEVFTGQWPG